MAALVAWLVVVLRNPETRARWLEKLERLLIQQSVKKAFLEQTFSL